MSQPDPREVPPDAELTPEARAILQRARRSFGISITVLLVGFMAIGIALVYRATRDSGGPEDRYALEQVALPTGSEVVSVSAAEGLVTVTFLWEGETLTAIFDGATGDELAQFAVVAE